MIKLSKRLETICNLVPKGARVCDVGCDHAYVDIRLLQEEKVPYALAMDVADGPLATAKANLELTELYDTGRCELRKSNGLSAYEPGEAEVMICAGMGGILMQSLLEAESEKVLSFQELILSPQSEIHLVREWLFQNGCRITEERFLRDEGKYYTVITAEPCTAPENDAVSLSEGAFGSKSLLPETEMQRRPDWDGMADEIQNLPEETLQRAMVDRQQLHKVLQEPAFRDYAEKTWGPCILEEYFSFSRKGGASEHASGSDEQDVPCLQISRKGTGVSETAAGSDAEQEADCDTNPKKSSSSAECFLQYVTESLRAKIRLADTLSQQSPGENTLQRLRELGGEIGILQVLLAARKVVEG